MFKDYVDIEGRPSKITVLKITPQASEGAYTVTDPGFAEYGIATEPGSMLIDQAATAGRYGRPAGFSPEEFSDGVIDGIVMPGNHFGWQEGAFQVKDGDPVLLANDEGVLTGNFPTLAMDNSGHWSVVDIAFENGKPQQSIEGMSIGMNGAQIVRDGEVVALGDMLNDPRILADLRNLFDFSNGEKVVGEFFQLVRKFSPNGSQNSLNPAMLRRLADGGSSVVFRAPVPTDEAERVPYQQLMTMVNGDGKDIPGLPHMKMDEHRDPKTEKSVYRLGMTPLPEQKMPLAGFGTDPEGNLIVVSVDGRQEDSIGVSIRELAELLVENGAEDAVLGCGGGDVAIVQKVNGESRVLTSPANKDSSGNRVTRKSPNVLIIPAT